jgi:hypothetical protein
MPTGATMNASSPATDSAAKQTNVPTVTPFPRASNLKRETGNVDTTKLITTSDQDLGTFDLPATGYARSIVILVSPSVSGSGGSAAAAEDGPFSALKNISVAEPNGSTVPFFNSGYELMLANKFGGYRFANDPRQSPVFSAINATTGNFTFMLRIPLEITIREALGSLPNQDAASTFKLRMTLAKASDIYSVNPVTTLPTVRVQAWLESWEQPAAAVGSVPNETTPPAMNTTQFWSVTPYTQASGQNKTRLTRMGNYVRNFIFIFRRSASTRANGDSDWPSQITLWYDGRPIDVIDKNVWIQQIYERYGYFGTVDTAGARENGVFPYDFCHELIGKVGQETRDLWLETISSTKFEVEGNWGNAGTLTVLYNDVAVAGNVFM